MSVIMYLKRAFGEGFLAMWTTLSKEDKEDMREAARVEMRELGVRNLDD